MKTYQPTPLIIICLALIASLAPVSHGWGQEADSAPADTVWEEQERAEALLVELETAADSLRGIATQVRGLDETRREVLRWQGRRQLEVMQDVQAKLLSLVLDSRADGRPLDVDVVERLEAALAFEQRLYRLISTRWSREIDDLREQRGSTAVEDLGSLETRTTEARTILDELLQAQVHVLTMTDSLGTTAEDAWSDLDREMLSRAETLVGRLQLAVKRRDELDTRLRSLLRSGSAEDVGPDRLRLEEARHRVDGVARSLTVTANLMRQRGMETAQYRQFIIQATGEITENILDPKVLVGLLRQLISDIWAWMGENIPAFLVKLGIVFLFVLTFQLGFRVSWWLFGLVGLSWLSRLMQDLVGRIILPFATVAGLFFGLLFIGLDATTLLTGVGVAGVIVGLALQDSLSNIAAGVFILFTRPFDVDDVVSTGSVLGTVRTMGIANTTIVTFDGSRLMIPNRRIWGEVIENRSVEPNRRIQVTVRVSYEDDIDRVIAILQKLVQEDERVLTEPRPQVFVKDLGESAAEVAVWPWVQNHDWWPLLTALPRAIRLRLAEEGIDVPYPRRDIHVTEASGVD